MQPEIFPEIAALSRIIGTTDAVGAPFPTLAEQKEEEERFAAVAASLRKIAEFNNQNIGNKKRL